MKIPLFVEFHPIIICTKISFTVVNFTFKHMILIDKIISFHFRESYFDCTFTYTQLYYFCNGKALMVIHNNLSDAIYHLFLLTFYVYTKRKTQNTNKTNSDNKCFRAVSEMKLIGIQFNNNWIFCVNYNWNFSRWQQTTSNAKYLISTAPIAAPVSIRTFLNWFDISCTVCIMYTTIEMGIERVQYSGILYTH